MAESISEILDPRCVELDLSSRRKPDIVRELAELLAKGHDVADVDRLVEELLERERLSSTGVGNRIVVVAFVLQNEVATAQTAQIHAEGAATEGFRLFTPADAAGHGLRMTFPAGREWRLGEDEDLEVTLSAATTVGFSVLYFTEAV